MNWNEQPFVIFAWFNDTLLYFILGENPAAMQVST